MYFFGLYHWRVRLKRLLRALAVGAVALAVGRSRSRWRQAVGVLGVGWALHRGGSALDALCSPAPWVVERYKYEALARVLPTDGVESWLDVFDDRVVLGNGPRLAARNATKAGLDAAMVRGDAARVPVAAGSQDVVTACRLLHDLPREDALATLSDLYRACAPGGAVGVLEIPITHDGRDEDPAAYWPSLVAEAGFDVKTVEEVPRRRSDDAYVVVVGLAG